jgi:hypothetical protein
MHELKEVDILSTKMDLLMKSSMIEPVRRKKSYTFMILA